MIRGLPRGAGAIVFAWLATLAFGVSAEQRDATQVEQTPIERPTSSLTATEQASRWGLTVEDWTRYQSLMTGPRGTWSPSLDPVTALGVHADTDAERRRYAEILVRLERERTMRELAFEKVVQEVKRELYPNEPLLDPEKLKTLLEARTREPPYRAGDRMLLFVNLFMKREFGSKRIEQFLPRLDLTDVIDTSGAYIPGHNGHGGEGTPTVILFGRDRPPVGDTVRTVMGIKGEPTTPDDPTQGQVWRTIVTQVDRAGSESAYVSVTDIPRDTFARPPWSIGGGGVTEVLNSLNSSGHGLLKNKIARRQIVFWIGDREVTREVLELGFASFTGADEVLLAPASSYGRAGIAADMIRQIIIGDSVRDWVANAATDDALVPYDADQNLLALETGSPWGRFLWPYRATLSGIVSFNNQTKAQLGTPWWAWYRWVRDRYLTPVSITFAFVATHSHFVLERGGKVFSRTRRACMEDDEEPIANVADRVAETLGPGPHADFNEFLSAVERDADTHGVKLTAKRKKLLQTVLAERDEGAREVIARVHRPAKTEPDPLRGLFSATVNGKECVVEYEPDTDLRDIEQVPLLEEGGIEAFIRHEVLPHAPDAWYDPQSVKIGYEISFTRYFYKPQPLRTLDKIRADILALENETEGLLGEIIGSGR